MKIDWTMALIVCIGANAFWAVLFTLIKQDMWEKGAYKKYSHLPFYKQVIQKDRWVMGETKTERWILFVSVFPIFVITKTILVLCAMAKAAFEAFKDEIRHW